MTAHGATKAKAINRLREKFTDAANLHGGRLNGASTVAAVAESWLIELRQTRRAEGTISSYERVVKMHVLPELGSLRVHEVTAAGITRWLRSREGNRKMCRTVASHIMKHAILEGAAEHNVVLMAAPLSDIESRPRVALPRALKAHEIAALSRAVNEWETAEPNRSIPLADMVLLQLATGLRIGELLALAWNSVDLEAQTLVVEATLTMPAGGVKRVAATKSDAGERVIRLPQTAVAMLERRQRSGIWPTSGEFPVFPSSRGTWMWPHNARRALRDARALSTDVDLSWVRPHTFRKTAGTAAIEEHGLIAGSKLLGHASTGITESAYFDRRAHINDVAEAIDSLLGAWEPSVERPAR